MFDVARKGKYALRRITFFDGRAGSTHELCIEDTEKCIVICRFDTDGECVDVCGRMFNLMMNEKTEELFDIGDLYAVARVIIKGTDIYEFD